jgi:hypothetical protein
MRVSKTNLAQINYEVSMKKLILFFCLIPTFAVAQTLCGSSEVPILSGKVGSLKNNKFAGSKYVSLCAVGTSSPYSRITYRFGTSEKIELEYRTPEHGEMYTTGEAFAPGASLSVVYFKKGKFTYALVKCSGGDCGRSESIELQVFNGSKNIAKLVGDPNKFLLSISDLEEISGAGVKSRESELSFAEFFTNHGREIPAAR